MYVCLTPSLCLRTEQSFWWRRASWAINVPCPNNFQLRSWCDVNNLPQQLPTTFFMLRYSLVLRIFKHERVSHHKGEFTYTVFHGCKKSLLVIRAQLMLYGLHSITFPTLCHLKATICCSTGSLGSGGTSTWVNLHANLAKEDHINLEAHLLEKHVLVYGKTRTPPSCGFHFCGDFGMEKSFFATLPSYFF